MPSTKRQRRAHRAPRHGTIFFAAGPTLVIPAGTTGPVYDTLAAPTGTGRLLRLDFAAVQPAAAQTITATISVDLSLKGGDGSGYVMAANEFGGYSIQ